VRAGAFEGADGDSAGGLGTGEGEMDGGWGKGPDAHAGDAHRGEVARFAEDREVDGPASADEEHARAGSDAGEEAYEDDLSDVGPLLGGYRPSSLRLIDEAVAAAQAIEPSLSLFEGTPGDASRSELHGGNGVSRVAANGEGGAEADRGDDAEDPSAEPALIVAAPLRAPEREESGLRMIGSLGRDRAEASGELASMGQARPRRSETARELVTILPRRITRELPALVTEQAQELAESLPTPTPTSPVLVPRTVTPPALEPPPAGQPVAPTAPRVPPPGSGVRAPSRSRRILRIMRPSASGGPGLAVMLLFLLAALLVVTAVVLRIRRNSRVGHIELTLDRAPASAALGSDRPGDGVTPPLPSTGDGVTPPLPGAGDGVTPPLPSTRADGSGGDGGGPATATATEPRGTVRASGSATAPDARAAGRGDRGAAKVADAKELYDRSHEALQEGDFARSLELAESSIRLRRTARTYLLRAQAQQRLDRVEDALASVDAAERLAPGYGTVWELRGRILWAARRRDEARAAFEKFLEIDPDSPRAAAVRRLLNEPR
jgi:hypothetical protein